MRSRIILATSIAILLIAAVAVLGKMILDELKQPEGASVPDVPAGQIILDWEMKPRFGLDQNKNGRMDLPNTYEYVHNLNKDCGNQCRSGPPTFELSIKLDGSKLFFTDGPQPPDRYTIRVLTPETKQDDGVLSGTNVPGLFSPVHLPEGPATIEVTARGRHQNESLVFVDTVTIQVEDFLIVAIGDSYSAGEGAPERRIHEGTESYGEWVGEIIEKMKDFLTPPAPGSRVEDVPRPFFIWADDGTSTFDGTAKTALRSPVIVAHHKSHRSTLSGVAQMALKLEQSDPRTSVTFVSLAASGASIREGLLGAYGGVNTEPLVTMSGQRMPPQVSEAATLVGCRGVGEGRKCDRQIDALLIGIGGNDVDFGKVLTALVDNDPFWDGAIDPLSKKYRSLMDDLWRQTRDRLASLDKRYEELAEAIRDKLPGIYNTYITLYPDPSLYRRTSTGSLETCSGMLRGIVANLEISESEAREAREHLIEPLNRLITAQAAEQGWIVTDPRKPFEGHGECQRFPPPFKGNPFPKALTPWPTPFLWRWFRNPADALSIQGTPAQGFAGSDDGIDRFLHVLTVRKALTKGTLHPNEFGYHQMALSLYSVLQLPVWISGTVRDDNDQIRETEPPLVAARDEIIRRGTLSSPTDVDLFALPQFSTGVRSPLTILAEPRKSQGAILRHPYTRLFTEDGKEIANGEGVIRVPVVTGTYYVGVSARTNREYDAVTGDGDEGGRERGTFRLRFARGVNGAPSPH